MAVRALVVVLAGVSRHGFGPGKTAFGTGQYRLKNQLGQSSVQLRSLLFRRGWETGVPCCLGQSFNRGLGTVERNPGFGLLKSHVRFNHAIDPG